LSLPKPLPLADQLCFTIYSASIAINRLYKPMLDRFGITYPQHLVLDVLAQEGDQTVGEIADRLALESSTITPLVKRLEAAGFVRRQRNPEDERQVIVTLLPKGRSLHQDSKCLSEKLLEQSGLTPPDLVRINTEVGGLRDALMKND
jgi:MarR family transcriptional regulator, organic hydroperoxide resistance regulator